MEHYLFDFDGVLADSMPAWIGIHAGNLRQAGIPVPDDFVETITPLGNVLGIEYLLSLGLKMTPQEYYEMAAQQHVHAYATQVQPKPYVAEALQRLKAQGFALHVLSANSRVCLEDCLNRWQLDRFFDHIWSTDDFGLPKTDPELFRQAAEVSQCTMVDDNIRAITTAKEAGLHTVGVYDETSRSTEPAMRQTAERYILDFSEL